MIVEVTPGLVFSGILVVILLSPPLSMLLSAILLWRYRRAVLAAMAESATGAPATHATPSPSSLSLPMASPPAERASAAAGGNAGTVLLATLALRARHAATRVVVAGVAFALVIASAFVVAHEPLRSPTGFALALWTALWPIVPGLALGATAPARSAALAGLAYLLPLAALVAEAVLLPASTTQVFGGPAAAIRAAWSPPELVGVWLLFNGVPTLLLLLFLNRWTRAVGPLVLAFSTAVLSAFLVGYFAMVTAPGLAMIDATTRIAGQLFGAVLIILALLAAAALGAGVAVVLLRSIRRNYVAKTLNDRSLTRDSVWFVFAVYYGMGFALIGIGWLAVGVLAWLAVDVIARRGSAVGSTAASPAEATGHGLIFLRVFSLGRRSEQLFAALSRRWRLVGSIQLITGPDLARSTVQPHQWLDFVSGRLRSHFIADDRSLMQRVDGCDRAPDRDGIYRVNGLFCRADTWERALLRLVEHGDAVLMDLRSFGKGNAGCIAELRHLVHRVPLSRCTWVVDDDTDRIFLQQTLEQAWHDMPPQAPNRGTTPLAAPLHVLAPRRRGVESLLARLAATAQAARRAPDAGWPGLAHGLAGG